MKKNDNDLKNLKNSAINSLDDDFEEGKGMLINTKNTEASSGAQVPLTDTEKLILSAILISMTSTCLLSLSVLSFLPTYIEEKNEKDPKNFDISKTLTGVIIS
jgi:hypothetical protein